MCVIYCAGKIGKSAKEKICGIYEKEIEGFADTHKKGEFEGYPIIPIEDVDSNTPIVIANDDPYAVVSIYESLLLKGFTQIYWYLNMDGSQVHPKTFFEDECICISMWGSCTLPDLEVHIADNCNLNCKGCTHFSPLFNEVGVEFESRIDDVIAVKNKVSNIARLDILGGEPLLNSEIDKYVVTLRNNLPDTRISIFSNGILIPRLSDETLDIIADNHIGFMISLYPLTINMMDRIKDRLNEHDIRYKITVLRDKFVLPITTKRDTVLDYKCMSNGCVSIADGKIARCPTLLYIDKFNSTFNENLPDEGIYSIRECPEGDELRQLLKQSVPLCEYCVFKEIEWEPCGNVIKKEYFASNE